MPAVLYAIRKKSGTAFFPAVSIGGNGWILVSQALFVDNEALLIAEHPDPASFSALISDVVFEGEGFQNKFIAEGCFTHRLPL